MKIAIITSNFGGSSSSLAEAFLMRGHEVDFYNIVYTSQHCPEFESFTLPSMPHMLGMNENTSFETDGLRRFKQFRCRFRFYNVVSLGMPKGANIMSLIKRACSIWTQKIIFSSLKNKKYDFVNVIGQNPFSISLSMLLKRWNLPVVHSFHEVLSNHLETKQLFPGIEKILDKGIRVNVFSEKSLDDLKRITTITQSQLSVIPFGLFTGYKEYSNVEIPELNGIGNYILFYGYIEKYKGLNVLYEAVRKLNDLNVKVVVAGKGTLPVLGTMKNDSRFILLNRWLGNAELVSLIRNCKFVVCPYLSASQSGIPQTVFNFDKPIIATDIESFQDIIQHNDNGLIVERNNIKDLSSAIKKMCMDNELYAKMVNNIHDYQTFYSNKEWKNIADKYLKL